MRTKVYIICFNFISIFYFLFPGGEAEGLGPISEAVIIMGSYYGFSLPPIVLAFERFRIFSDPKGFRKVNLQKVLKGFIKGFGLLKGFTFRIFSHERF